MQNNKIACFFATSGHSGVDRAMQHLIPALLERGYQVDLLHVRKHGPYLDPVPAGLNIIDLKTKHVYSSYFKVLRYLRQHRPYVMLSDKDRVNRTALLAKLAARVATKHVVSSGTTISIDLSHRGPLDRWLQRQSMGKLYRIADNVIVTSHGVADDMAAYTGLPREKIQVVPCPVIPARLFNEQLKCPDHPWFHQTEPLILSVGALVERKDFATLIRAFAQVQKKRKCRLMILGKGKQQQRLLELAEQLGVGQQVALPGFVDNPYAYIAHADLFAFSSRWEGLGFVLIEALALGTPVVSTDCPSGPREILGDGKYGALVPVGDHQALADEMFNALNKQPDKAFLQQAARQYEIENSTSAYLKAMFLPDVAPVN